ncbi:hypothetical protein BCR44DRAFT_1512398 [Catenaria anguillulae PL171]|uniref:Uncharacterized protein n=1 Tax=Catenaria anguillulae PL171 TaxID=765915 RepID=A0A1Y2HPR0_9FUNG|nr:hypothetical protein BCR44DRAFT_1512398 [Catenaria anguillulae PL171]
MMMPSSRSTSVHLPRELIDDILHVAIASLPKESAGAERHSVVNTLLPVVSPSTQLLRAVVGRLDFDRPAAADSAGRDSNELASIALAAAAEQGHVDVLEWWFTAASSGNHSNRGGTGVVPPMPRLASLLPMICKGRSRTAQDRIMVSLDWLKAHGHLPSLQELGPGYSDLFSTCIELGNAMVSTAASQGDVGLLALLPNIDLGWTTLTTLLNFIRLFYQASAIVIAMSLNGGANTLTLIRKWLTTCVRLSMPISCSASVILNLTGSSLMYCNIMTGPLRRH